MKHVEMGCKLGLEFVFFISEQFKGRSLWSRQIFVHSATAMALNKNPAMSPSSSIHCGQYDTTYATIGDILRKAFADDTILGDESVPARTRRAKNYVKFALFPR